MDKETALHKINTLLTYLSEEEKLVAMYNIGYDAGRNYLFNRGQKTVYEFNKDKQLLGEYPSVTDAARKKGVHKTTLYGAIWAKRQTRDTHYWSYEKTLF